MIFFCFSNVQDIKPANLMMCNDGVVKITDFGLAAYSLKREVDPETRATAKDRYGNPTEILCAEFMGGTPSYFCAQQQSIAADWEKIDEAEARRAFKETRLLTVRTSDLYQVSMTVFEMHAQYLPHAGDSSTLAFTPLDAAKRCALRTPDFELVEFSPEQTEQWLAKTKIGPQLEKGELVAKGIGGAKLLELSQIKDWKEVKKELRVKNMAQARKLQMALRRNTSTRRNAMHWKIGEMVCKSLVDDVKERPMTMADALEILGAKLNRAGELENLSRAHGYGELPAQAKETAAAHDDENIASTFGGLAKRLVLDGDMPGALDVCGEWLGVSSSDAGHAQAFDAYCNLWKRHGGELPRLLDLSRKARGHWKQGMLRGDKEIVIERLVRDLMHGGVMPLLERIDLTRQERLEGPVLETLLGSDSNEQAKQRRNTFGLLLCECLLGRRSPKIEPEIDIAVSGSAPPPAAKNDASLDKLVVLSLENCRRASGRIPPAIGRRCTGLQTLNLGQCRHAGVGFCRTSVSCRRVGAGGCMSLSLSV